MYIHILICLDIEHRHVWYIHIWYLYIYDIYSIYIYSIYIDNLYIITIYIVILRHIMYITVSLLHLQIARSLCSWWRHTKFFNLLKWSQMFVIESEYTKTSGCMNASNHWESPHFQHKWPFTDSSAFMDKSGDPWCHQGCRIPTVPLPNLWTCGNIWNGFA